MKTLKRLPALILLSILIIALSCNTKAEAIHTENWGEANNKPVYLYTLTNKNGTQAKLTNYGAILTSLLIPDKDNNFTDVVLGFDNLDQYVADNPCFGATIGRFANRIRNGQFKIDSTTYNIVKNADKHHIHGALEFNRAVWDGSTFTNESGIGVVFKYLSKDGSMGFPGNLDVTVTYTLTNNNDLKIDFEATTDKTTHVNLTHHSYFNLAGTDKLIYDHKIKIDADNITTIDEDIVPTGEMELVKNTDKDLTSYTRIRDHIGKFKNNGYHFCYVFNKDLKEAKKVIEVIEPESGRTMAVTATQPSVQFYSGNAISEKIIGKYGVNYKPHSAFCLETQHLPNTPNLPNFPTTLLKPNETYKEHVIYSFGITSEEASTKPKKKKRPIALENGKFFESDGRKMLYGGKDSIQHFDISNSSLKDGQFHYGIGREKFPALLNPEFITIKQADTIWEDNSRFLLAHSGNDIKAYSVKDLTRHEVVNDVLNGQPIMAVYCILADLGAIYERNYGDTELTFALSGYTYFDNDVWDGLDGFVLWDRETESLWWPLIGKAVSGSLKDVKLLEMDKTNWKDITWKDIKTNYPNAQVLKSNQDFERPTKWTKLEDVTEIKNQFIQNDN
ncbi:aldose epimerase family protein [Seonamhaeicola maritimus]|nr:galactose-1-epimerase [Seonamhaeicola maritimus]